MNCKKLIFTIIAFLAQNAAAEVLPKGVGAYSLGYRKYSPNDSYFDDSGNQHALGNKMDLDFSSDAMAAGKAGTQLQTLHDEIKKFDSKGSTNSPSDQMNFGKIEGNVKTDISTEFFGMGYGVNDKWTIFGGVPFVSAKVDTTMTYTGNNNANQIKSQLGNLVYKEIQDGLDKASHLSAESVREDLEVNKGYAPINHWEYNGVGDTTLGTKTDIQGKGSEWRRFNLGLQLQLDLATGHADDTDNLIDVAIGRGYHALTVATDSKVNLNYLSLGIKNMATQGVSRQVSRRVPLDADSVVGADRKALVNWIPGRDVGAAFYIASGNKWLKGSYTLGGKRHYIDHYSGSLEGNYETLSQNSDKIQTYQEAAVSLTTVEAFTRKQFAIPLIVSLIGHDTIAGINAPKETYIELSVTSFFSTPAAAKTTSTDKPTDRGNRQTKLAASH